MSESHEELTAGLRALEEHLAMLRSEIENDAGSRRQRDAALIRAVRVLYAIGPIAVPSPTPGGPSAGPSTPTTINCPRCTNPVTVTLS